jgi:hypothetical protein
VVIQLANRETISPIGIVRDVEVSWEFRDSSHGDGLTKGLDGVRHGSGSRLCY